MKDLTKGKPMHLIFSFALPVLLGNVLQLLYNLIDTRIVGETLGKQSLAAVGATNSVNTLVVGFLLGLTGGFAVVVARYFGAKDFNKMKEAVAATFVLGLVTALILTLLSVIFTKPLLILLRTPKELMPESYAYIHIIFLGMTITMLYNVCASILRAVGDTLTPLIILFGSTILNIGLDYLFILQFHLGVKGAAYATIISQMFSVVVCLVYIVKKYPMLRLKREDFIFHRTLVVFMYRSGISMGFMLSFVSLGTVALQSSINTFGTNTIAAHTAARKITELYMLAFSVFGTTMATYCGQNFGAGQIARINEGLKKVILISWFWSIGVMIASFTIAPKLVMLVTATNDPEIIQTATLYLKINTLFYFVPAMITIIRNAMQGIGDYKTPIISSMIELIGKFLIALFLAPKLQYMGIIIAEPIVWCVMVIPLLVKILRTPVLRESKSSI